MALSVLYESAEVARYDCQAQGGGGRKELVVGKLPTKILDFRGLTQAES